MRIGNETGLTLVTLLMSVLPTVQFISQVLHSVSDKNWLVGRPGANLLITAFQLCVSSPCRSLL